jgi:SEC-C motif
VEVVGRNEPCPCGSGRKYKKCCLAKPGIGLGAFTRSERESALAGLTRFAHRPEFEEEHEHADDEFWEQQDPDGLTDDEAERLDELEDDEEYAFHTWFFFDYQLADGRRLAEVFLEREGSRLRAGEREYLTRMLATQLRLYEVIEVQPEEGVRLVDLWTDERSWVSERTATRELVQWDLLGARLMPGEHGDLVMDGAPYLYPAAAREDIVEALRDASTESGDREPAALFKRTAPLFHWLWLDHVALPPRPEVVTAEGDPVVFARVVFDLEDRARVLSALGSHPDVAAGKDGIFGWYEAKDADGMRRSLGSFVLEENRLVFETMSEARAARGRGFLEGLAGGAVTYRTTEYRDVDEALEDGTETASSAPDEVPPDLQAAVAGEFYAQHYRDWPDTPLRALGNRTPREAAGLAEWRPALVALLKDFESRSERQRRAGQTAYDFRWLWGELGLPRPK